ncbi:sulfite exporter TauE/SafE family protein [Desulfothermobacter acidiphilus]|uniref:sulfite exporter TauE/SafE family protein n=1 Tax=Desulfothermobacter acidiphilus TaxID=1938353 RepID=UPI003F8CD753
MRFPVAGIDVSPCLPPLVSLAVATLTTPAGVSGAFLLLPFQVSVLGFTSPAVSPTNLVYNLVAIPGGLWRYLREGRMAWPLTWVVVAGTLPGVFAGTLIRLNYLPNPRAFKFFVGLVLLYLGGRLLYELTGRYSRGRERLRSLEAKFKGRALAARREGRLAAGLPEEAVVRTCTFNWRQVEYEFWGEKFSFNVPVLFLVALVVGIVGGIYGIGGGAIIAPFCCAVFGLPAYTVAGAALAGTFLTSIVGVVYYTILAPFYPQMAVKPDWLLGLFFGVGGLLGTTLGASLQKYLPEKLLRAFLGLLVFSLGLTYILSGFFS